MHVQLHEGRVADALEAVNLARLDDEDVPCSSLELLAVHVVQSASGSHELYFVVRVPMRSWPAAGKRVEEEHGDIDVALVGADELVRAANERKLFLTDTVHSDLGKGWAVRLQSSDPTDCAAIGTSAFVPEISEILKQLLVGDDELRDHDACGRASFPIVAGNVRAPTRVSALHEQPSSVHVHLSHPDPRAF
jgi:hypothetical protein